MGIPEESLRLALMYFQKRLVMLGLVFSPMTSSPEDLSLEDC